MKPYWITFAEEASNIIIIIIIIIIINIIIIIMINCSGPMLFQTFFH